VSLARYRCGYCQLVTAVESSDTRLPQVAYATLWEHVAAAHFKESKPLRLMSVEQRKSTLLGWALG